MPRQPQRGFIHIPILIAVVLVVAVVASVTVFGSSTEGDGRGFEYLCRRFPRLPRCRTPSPSPSVIPSPVRSPVLTPAPSTRPTPTASPKASRSPTDSPYTYKEPGGKYTITIPAGWVVNRTTSTTTFSTTKFTGPNGYVAITFGSGKDPIGGCSETTNVELADRTIAGCFLLQKDGSQILTRAYTKDKAGIDFTIEAYMNPPLSYHRPVVLDVIKTIDIE